MGDRRILTDGITEYVSRTYQDELEEISLKKNTIIHLPTGSGKTFIATRLIKNFREALRKPWGGGGKRTFFLVNTVPLVNQQKKQIERQCPVTVGAYSGEDGVDYWNKAKWDEELTKNEVIVMTSQILADMLTHSYIMIKDLNLIIFDECHHAVENHPMRLVMKHFKACPVEEQPRVLGLTATLLNSNVSKLNVDDALKTLEKTFHATIATVNDLGEVLNYSTNPNEYVQFYHSARPTTDFLEFRTLLLKLQDDVMKYKLPIKSSHDIKLKERQEDITTDPKKIMKNLKNIIVSIVTLLEELGAYGASLAILSYIILLERLKRKTTTKEEEILYKLTITQILKARMILVNSMKGDTGYDKIIKHSSEKVTMVLDILKEFNPDTINKPGVLLKVNQSRQPLSAIIFTQQRFTAKVLFNILKDVKVANPEEYDFLKHDFIVGANMNPFKDTREYYYNKKASQKALLMFANRELNCLISTSVIEEGVDIPQCLLVLKFDQPLEYRSYIQSKGRARSSKSSYVIMVDQANRTKFMRQYEVYQQTEQIIQRILVGNTDDRDAPSMGEIQEDLYDEDEIPPYVTKDGAVLSAVSAASLLSRYCSVLPHDQFTTIAPMWVQETVSDPNGATMRIVSVIMPIACPIKEQITGSAQSSTRTARRAAALAACAALHAAGELHPVTLLPQPYALVKFDAEEIKACFPNWPSDGGKEPEGVPKAGSKKRMRKYDLVFPSCLESRSLLQPFFLHVIKMKTNFEKPKDFRDGILYDFLQRDNGFGILTQNQLPKLCKFPLFTKIGEVITSLEVNYAVIELNDELFNLVKQFHLFIFDQVLGVAKKFLMFDGKVNSMYAVPIKGDKGFDIDWKIMTEHKTVRPVAVPSNEERKSMKINPEEYHECVVSPWYRGTLHPDRYIVSRVLEYKTPHSLFDDDSYETFSDYYAEKYNLHIVGPADQPLLEVKNITSGMNYLLMRSATLKTLTDKQQKLVAGVQGDFSAKGFLEILIPEYCIKYDFPGVLWYKAMILPDIFHRVYMLLVAQELLTMVANDTKYGTPTLAKMEEWKPIIADEKVIVNALLSQVEEKVPPLTVDRINNPINEDAPTRPNVGMADSFYQLQKKKIQAQYPWDEKMEPVDIERNISTVTVMDIECYEKFVTAPMAEMKQAMPKPNVVLAAAIRAPPLKFNETINLLNLTPTGRGPELKDILAALTTIKSQDSFNLERAETLGDSFLKFAATLYLYNKFPSLNEGQLTNIKSRLISNRNLYYAAEKINLGGRMKVEPFLPRKDFLVPGFFAPEQVRDFIEDNKIRPTFLISMQLPVDEVLTGELSATSWEQVQQRHLECHGVAELEPEGGAQNAMQCYVKKIAVSDKSLADCVEALIGTYLFSGGVLGAVKFLEWMKILPAADRFEEVLRNPLQVPTRLAEGKTTLAEIDFLLNNCRIDVEKILGYKFKDPSLLLEALSHASYIRNRVTRSYERLEFLGDAILDFLITSHIYENCVNIKPGEMTDLRSALVNNVTFAAYVVKLGLHKFICSRLNPVLDRAVIAFVEHQELRNHALLEEALYLIDEEDCQVAQYVEVPKVLSDVFEALAGAMFLDSGGDLQAVWRVYYRFMRADIQAFAENVPKQPVRLLYEDIHACAVFDSPRFLTSDNTKVTITVTLTKNDRQYRVQGVGSNKSQAKRAAAKVALKVLSM